MNVFVLQRKSDHFFYGGTYSQFHAEEHRAKLYRRKADCASAAARQTQMAFDNEVRQRIVDTYGSVKRSPDNRSYEGGTSDPRYKLERAEGKWNYYSDLSDDEKAIERDARYFVLTYEAKPVV